MDRTKTIFFAFTGKAIEQPEKIFVIGSGYECWDLKKFTLDEFCEEIKKRISPANEKALHNYKLEQEQYDKVSWGLLIPETIENSGFNYAETLFLLNIYSPNFLYPLFHVNDMGIDRNKFNKDPLIYFHTQNHSIFKTTNFITFYKVLFDQAKYGSWCLDRIQAWDKEDWRLFVAVLLYNGLKDYDNIKNSFDWQRESAEMSTILESLFTADDSRNEEIIYRLSKRIAVLLNWIFPNIEKEIKKELYQNRSDFIHGAFFKQIAKESPGANNSIPTPDFRLLYKHKEYVRCALVAYLHLALLLKQNPEEYKGIKTVMGVIEESIIDMDLREKIVGKTKTLFSLMPEVTLSQF